MPGLCLSGNQSAEWHWPCRGGLTEGERLDKEGGIMRAVERFVNAHTTKTSNVRQIVTNTVYTVSLSATGPPSQKR